MAQSASGDDNNDNATATTTQEGDGDDDETYCVSNSDNETYARIHAANTEAMMWMHGIWISMLHKRCILEQKRIEQKRFHTTTRAKAKRTSWDDDHIPRDVQMYPND